MRDLELLTIAVTKRALGIHWVLRIAEHSVGGGYEDSLWKALDAANAEIEKQFFDPLGKYYQQYVAPRKDQDDE